MWLEPDWLVLSHVALWKPLALCCPCSRWWLKLLLSLNPGSVQGILAGIALPTGSLSSQLSSSFYCEVSIVCSGDHMICLGSGSLLLSTTWLMDRNHRPGKRPQSKIPHMHSSGYGLFWHDCKSAKAKPLEGGHNPVDLLGYCHKDPMRRSSWDAYHERWLLVLIATVSDDRRPRCAAVIWF